MKVVENNCKQCYLEMLISVFTTFAFLILGISKGEGEGIEEFMLEITSYCCKYLFQQDAK